MNIFDGMSGMQIENLLNLGRDAGFGGYAPQQSIMNRPQPAPSMEEMQGGLSMNHPQGGSLMGQGEGTGNQTAQMPGDSNGGMDVAGFANYGMQAPPLQDPMAQLGGLMSMNKQQQNPIQQLPQGNLMSYLMQLGAI